MSDEPVDLWVGRPPRRTRYHNNPSGCTHGGIDTCPSCADLDAYEAEAMRRFLAGEPKP